MNTRRLLSTRWFVAALIMSLFICGCDMELKRGIQNYKGDGTIRYLEPPGVLGRSGCAIEMPRFDLSKPFHADYNLSGIPQIAGYYVIYLVVPGPRRPENVLDTVFIISISKDGKLITRLSSTVNDIAKGYWKGKNWFYFQRKGVITVDNDKERWSLAVSCENTSLTERVNAYIWISAGGFK